MVTAVYTPPVSRELANENCSIRGSKIAMMPGSSRAASTVSNIFASANAALKICSTMCLCEGPSCAS